MDKEFVKDFQATVIKLTENYRSTTTKPLITVANAIHPAN
jgi:superfamily I DNA/RNA helicase